MSTFRLGVNYWPARTAMRWWSMFDRPEVDRDFARIAEVGFGEVRIFLLWEAFQLRPGVVPRESIANLVAVLDTAASRGLTVTATLFCGHMSGVNWLPGWVVENTSAPGRFRTVVSDRVVDGVRARDIYTDPALLGHQLDLARLLADEVGRHPALGGWDLGNEFSNVAVPTTHRAVAAWSEALTAVLRRPGIAVTGGLHGEDLEADRAIRPSSIGRSWDVVAMHGYPLYSPDARGPDDPDWLPFLCRLAGEFARRPVLAQEFGLPDHELGEERVARYCRSVLERLWLAGVVGALWWCYADYDPALTALPPFDLARHELHFGLTRADGSAKPVVEVFRDFGGREVREASGLAELDEDRFYAGLPTSITAAYAAARPHEPVPDRAG